MKPDVECKDVIGKLGLFDFMLVMIARLNAA